MNPIFPNLLSIHTYSVLTNFSKTIRNESMTSWKYMNIIRLLWWLSRYKMCICCKLNTLCSCNWDKQGKSLQYKNFFSEKIRYVSIFLHHETFHNYMKEERLRDNKLRKCKYYLTKKFMWNVAFFGVNGLLQRDISMSMTYGTINHIYKSLIMALSFG